MPDHPSLPAPFSTRSPIQRALRTATGQIRSGQRLTIALAITLTGAALTGAALPLGLGAGLTLAMASSAQAAGVTFHQGVYQDFAYAWGDSFQAITGQWDDLPRPVCRVVGAYQSCLYAGSPLSLRIVGRQPTKGLGIVALEAQIDDRHDIATLRTASIVLARIVHRASGADRALASRIDGLLAGHLRTDAMGDRIGTIFTNWYDLTVRFPARGHGVVVRVSAPKSVNSNLGAAPRANDPDWNAPRPWQDQPYFAPRMPDWSDEDWRAPPHGPMPNGGNPGGLIPRAPQPQSPNRVAPNSNGQPQPSPTPAPVQQQPEPTRPVEPPRPQQPTPPPVPRVEPPHVEPAPPQAPAPQAPAPQAPAPQAPAPQAPAPQAPAPQAAPPQAPAPQAPAPQAPAPQAAPPQAPAPQAPAPQAAPPQAPAPQAPAPQAAPPQAPGKAKPGEPCPPDQVCK